MVVGAWGYLIATGSISTIWPMFGAANQLLGTLALCIATTVLIKMRKSRYVWVTVIPMAFVGAITLTGAYEMLVLFIAKATATDVPGQAVALYIDAVLVGIVALLAVIVLADSMRQWYGYVVLKRAFTSSEVVVSSGGSAVSGRLTATGGIHLPPGGCC
jgi:carbon starvation protein